MIDPGPIDAVLINPVRIDTGSIHSGCAARSDRAGG